VGGWGCRARGVAERGERRENGGKRAIVVGGIDAPGELMSLNPRLLDSNSDTHYFTPPGHACASQATSMNNEFRVQCL